MRRLAVLVLLCVVAVSACRSSPGSKAVPAPKGLPGFYAVPSGVSKKSPGTLLKSEAVPAVAVNGTVHRIMYVSTDAAGKHVPVTGAVFVPPTPAPPEGYPVVSWAHGTNGLADQCAPSLQPGNDVLPPVVINGMLGLGWEVVATDYQGEGTPPGLLPFLVGSVAAHNAIDIVLAARELPSSRAGTDYIVWGHSEGGQSALFAWRLANTYGARGGLEMVGALAASPPSQLSSLWQSLSGTPARVYLYLMLAGFNSAYGNKAAPLDAVLTQKGSALLPTLQRGCLGPVASSVNDSPFAELVKSNPFDVEAWRKLFTQNDPASFTSGSAVPLLIVHGAADEVVPAATSAELAKQLCAKGANLERWVYPAQSHGGVLFVAALDMGRWMMDRFRGSATPYRPTAEGVRVGTCAG